MKRILFIIASLVFFGACKKATTTHSVTVTPLPSNYVSVIVNGDTVTGTASGSGALFLTIPNGAKIYFNIGTWYNMSNRVVSSGSYTLSTGYYNTSGILVESWASYSTGSDIYYTDASHTGYLGISDTNNVITGSFNFIAVDSAGHTVSITGGIINKVNI